MNTNSEVQQVGSYDLFQETIRHRDRMFEMAKEIIALQKLTITELDEKIERKEKRIIELEQGQNEYKKIQETKVWAVKLQIVPRS